MNFKLQLSLSFVLIYSILISISLLLTYRAFKNFSEEAFFDRLEQKAFITVELLAELKEDDSTINHIINGNSLLKINHEKIYVFDKNNKLIYENGSYVNFNFGIPLIERIRKEKEVEFFIHDGFQVCGIEHTYNNKEYVVVIIAKDAFGVVKLKNLKEFIIFPLLLTIFLVFIAAYYYIKQVFKPVDKLNATIQKVTDTNLYQHLEAKSSSKDINQIAQNFNKMLDRLQESFETQKNFNQSASHQLKTPLAVMSSLIRKLETNPNQKEETIQLLQDENDKMAKLVDYLLLINRLRGKAPIPFADFRIDEVLFEVSEEAEELHNNFSLLLDIKSDDNGEDNFTYFGNKILIKSAISNMINNAVLYSIEHKISIKLFAQNKLIRLQFINDGKKALEEAIFSPFFRSENSSSISGNGLGLHIVKSIVEFHKGIIYYTFSEQDQEHTFTIELYKD